MPNAVQWHHPRVQDGSEDAARRLGRDRVQPNESLGHPRPSYISRPPTCPVLTDRAYPTGNS
ncbi:hypothetical protein CLIM01_08645 [Colletotrichum limetticola]|uniref:Uncharacterized protein n=1 Tax=Colletotrichum limetticola TaxID=1209924 RepID=A0ABQ9PR09_9PEZI|nr:hypothetical protein CLIM01_08645 [Colletotrichum limetticola]